jgi:sugar lactone lactonase YvrE
LLIATLRLYDVDGMSENRGNWRVNTLTRSLTTAMAVVSLVAPVVHAVPSPAAVDEFARLQSELRASHADSDTAAYLRASQTLYAFLNGSPRATLQLMSAEALSGNTDEALGYFSQYVAMGQAGEEALKAKSFDPLRDLPKYQSIYAGMAANTTPIFAADEAFRLQTPARVPEDIDFDPSGKFFYISTVLGQQILQVDMTGRPKVFANSPDHWPMMALKIDAHRRVLWATEVAIDGFASVPKADWGRSAVLIYDLRSARLLRRIEAPAKAALGDMALDSDGNAVVCDGELGGVYRISRVSFKVERIDAGDFISPQTPAVLPDGKHVLVPDYVRGIGVLDLDSKAVAWLPMQGKFAMSGIDGLYAAGSTWIATQNGASPERVVRFLLNDSNMGVISESIIERATPTLGDPTHGVIVGPYFYYIANSGWDTLDDHGNVLEGKTLPLGSIRRAKIS